MNIHEILACVYIVLSVLAGFYLSYRWGRLHGRDTAYDECARDADRRYKEGLSDGQKLGYTKGRAEGYEDGRRYEAVTHHNQTELEKLLEKETRQ